MPDAAPTTRRRILAGFGAAATVGVAGCSDQIWSRAEGPSAERVSLTIKTVPADDDMIAAKISNQLTESFRAAGIDTAHEPMAESELYREVLVDGDFDVFVARYSGLDELDAIRPLLHSDFANERGWQNPFRFSDLTADEYLEDQLSEDGYTRRATFTELFEYLHDNAPYTVVAFPDHLAAARESLDISRPPRRTTDYIELLGEEVPDGPRDGPLRIRLFGEQQLSRLNPITVDENEIQSVLGLLYDPLIREIDGEYVPWLAEDISWETEGNTLFATVTLREGLTWHDEESLDADDVEFTIAFIEDTSLGEGESRVPSFRYRGRQSLVEDVERVDSTSVRYDFGDVSEAVARRALTIPILPKHVWEPRSELISEQQTDALSWDNEEPIGSGLFAVVEPADEELLELEAFEEHVLRNGSDPEDPSTFDSHYEGLELSLSPNEGAAIDSLADGDVDLIASPIQPEAFEPLAEDEELGQLSATTRSFYVVGYNTQHPELGNPRFRTVLSRLIDRENVVSEFFEGYGEPATTLSSLVGIVPDEWDHPRSAAVSEFPGEDGEIDDERVRSLFEEAGYRYEDGELYS